MQRLAEAVLEKQHRVYYFDRAGTTIDISRLDPDAADEGESRWGGLGEFSARANAAVADAVAAAGVEP